MSDKREIKTTKAETSLEIWVECPYCDQYQEVTSKLKDELESDLRAYHLENEIICGDEDCKKTFIVEEITY